jgi:hypothetical protein
MVADFLSIFGDMKISPTSAELIFYPDVSAIFAQCRFAILPSCKINFRTVPICYFAQMSEQFLQKKTNASVETDVLLLLLLSFLKKNSAHLSQNL